MPESFVHLSLHTEYSIVDGIVRIKKLAAAVAKAGMPAVALTDQSNMFGLVKFYRACQAAGVKPIIGVDCWVTADDDTTQLYKLTLLCINNAGYLNLTQLVSKGYTEGQHRGIPMLKKSWFVGQTDGLIALSGGRLGDIGIALLNDNNEIASSLLNDWTTLFPNRFYLELQRTGRENEEIYLHAAVELAKKHDVPVVATNDVRFISTKDFDAHEARVCIHDGRTLDDPRRPKLYSEQQYLRSPEEMIELFKDIPSAIENTIEIAKRCTVELTLGKNYLPDFPIPDGLTIEQFLEKESREGLEKRLHQLFDVEADDYEDIRTKYHERLQIELDVINNMGFPGYFLIVADFIRWAKENDVPVGPGRGSGAGSIVAYALTITDLDPIKYDLLFERFLNPERVSMPDFDVDFCMEGRDRVIDYVARTYGRDKVSQIITYGSMAAKAVIRDVGRVLSHPYGFVDRIAKLIPFEIGITLKKALEQEPQLKELYDEDEEVAGLIDLAKSLEGIVRNAGKHAGGVVISPSKLTDFTPLYCEEDASNLVSQFDKDDVEAVGLVKFDFLGLRTLTIVDWAVKTINNIKRIKGEELVNIEKIPLDDVATFDLLKATNTTAVFQLESRGMKDLIKRLQPDEFEDIIALVALFRPGPLGSGMVDDFVNRKHGRARVVYPHPDLESILKPTYGVILYQEQVMQIAQVLANYSLGAADLLRRAMGKKKPEEMAKQRQIFTEGAVARDVDEKTATYIFDLMEKFAGYGFNKSHSAAYALVSYQTAWLKAHYPSEFMAAVLSADMDNTDKVVTLIDDCSEMKLKVSPPNINLCKHQFTVDDGTIIYGLGAIKGVGEAAIDGVIEEREKKGNFKNLFDFCQRVDLRKVNRRTLEGLTMAGAMDVFGQHRSTIMATLPDALKIAEQKSRDAQAGIQDMFGMVSIPDDDGNANGPESYSIQKDWSEELRLANEKSTLGLYLTGHPINRYLPELKKIVSGRLSEMKPTKNQTVIVAGLVIGMRVMTTKRGDKMAFLTLDDRSGRMEMAVFSEEFNANRENLAKDKLIVASVEVSLDDYSGGFKMRAKEIYDIAHAREHFAKNLMVTVDHNHAANGFINDLQRVLTPFKEGTCAVVVDYQKDDASAKIPLGEEWRVHPTDELLNRLRESMGDNKVNMTY
jgi:DNA polymerase-3 subunit alpha